MIILLKKADKEKEIFCREGESILSACIREGALLSNICGGKGLCGKCRICLVHGNLRITQEDKRIFTQEELTAGYRLACRAFPEETCAIELLQETEEFQVLSSYKKSSRLPDSCKEGAVSYRAAMDIGTTTIAMQFFHGRTGEILCTYTAVNPQRIYGADVMARIQASVEGKGEVLKKQLLEALQEGLLYFEGQLKEKGLSPAKGLERLVIAGNTTMMHLLLGYSCKGLSAYPFTPVTTEEIRLPLKELLPEREEACEVILLPGLSAFVGGDITAGLLYCGMNETERINLFVDLGTNGEMAIGNSSRILAASTAAGPAFEGGNISCGMGSVTGAVSGVTIKKDGGIVLKTIGGAEPKGLCGTGVVEAVYEGIIHERIEDNGYIPAEAGLVLQKDKIVLTQKDIRQLQLAKAAIRAGLETLVQEYGASLEEIENLYIAGGFGYRMNIKKAAGIGLIPPKLEKKALPMGNTALAGARTYALLPESEEKLKKILLTAREIPFSANRMFQEKYMDAMYFIT